MEAIGSETERGEQRRSECYKLRRARREEGKGRMEEALSTGGK